ncbi:hypothetical protein [Bradyrhizobium cosmicum]|uniref:DUF3617 family protein n=1 Tax=Bradyrhizobium cosmicum TaxID=1404864 RepID=A0AAI8MET4_9BRAD|nr:hypothetical protein [Bradyrhizobium cosmicum]BAL78928.1 hypothetical protein S23_57370 [Bradyrhizobium cosmicum]
MTIRNTLRFACAAVIAASFARVHAVQLKQMPIDFVGEWCNGSTFEGQTNWTLPSWVEEDGKCTNILSVSKYDFNMVIGKVSFSCVPDAIRQNQETAPSGTTYLATINAHCTTDTESGRGRPATFEFSRYKGNIYIKQK